MEDEMTDFDINIGKAAIERMTARASCRSFADTPIEDDKLDLILSAGLRAASGGNLQPFSIITVKDRQNAKELSALNGDQAFIEKAPLNLIFVLDWYKFSIYAAEKQAPFTCDRSFNHFIIGLEDVMCAAQTIETAAWLLGIASCYVGTCLFSGDEMAARYNLPKHSYPALVMSLGYPKTQPKQIKKLARDIVVFEESYPKLDSEFVRKQYYAKYEGMTTALPKTEPYRAEMLDSFRKALLTTYSAEITDEIAAKADKDGFISECQRRFGLHYHAEEMRELGKEVVSKIEAQGLNVFGKDE
jgi:FMN reductase [NAD(P)H]